MSEACRVPLRGAQRQRPTSNGSAPSRSFLDAVHLAGHAVAAVVCGGEYGALALHPGGSDGGDRYGCAFQEVPDLPGGGPARNATEAAIIVALAGGEAEALVGGGAPHSCSDVTSWLTDGDPGEAGPYVEKLGPT